MSANSAYAAILFTDIVGSSKLYTQLGNIDAKKTIDRVIDNIIQILPEFRGRLIKTIGDEVMAAFHNIDEAFQCAIKVNSKVSEINLKLRTGVCFGEVIIDQADFFGDVVNNAAFLTRTAHAGQILTDESTYALLPDTHKFRCELFDQIKLKGKRKKTLIYRFNWEEDNFSLSATQLARPAEPTDLIANKKLIIIVNGRTIEVTPESEAFTIGRDASAVNLFVTDINTSRKHCSIYHHRDKFIFEDHSSNGSYLYPSSGRKVFLRRETTPLSLTGLISLGLPKESAKTMLQYQLV